VKDRNMAAAKVLPSNRSKTPWLVQYRAHFWYFKTQSAALAFAKKFPKA
jgi:hypothetical protein